jgi:hypothetical protein
MFNTLLIATLLGLADPEAHASPGDSSEIATSAAREEATYDGSERELDVRAPRLSDPDIRIDGRLDDAAWTGAALLSGFTQFEPVEGSPASEETEVRVLVSDDALYFAVRAADASGGVRATLTERDGYNGSDDYVRFILDTFNDRRRAYVFMVNPHGIQGDGLWVEGQGGRFGPIDWSPDFLWESAGRLDQGGYSAELRIPLSSLRFQAAEAQDWGLQIEREIRRTGYRQSWAPVISDRASRLEQAGSLKGLRGLDGGMLLEVNPTVVASRQGRFDAQLGGLSRDPADTDVGMNLTYGLTSNLTLDGTINPDFSQIEADAGQIVVNERFALFLPEQRPFFLEGADIFSMPRRLVHTRSIVNPVGATKISGKVGSLNVAYLGAVDEVSLDGSNPIVNLVRLKQDLGTSSSLGLVYTDRTQPGTAFNRLLGSDARLVLGGRYTVTLLAAGSADRQPGSTTNWGSLVTASVNRADRNLALSASFEDVAEAFNAGSGFIRRTGVTQLQARTGYTFRGDRGALVERFGPFVEAQAYWDRDDFWGGRGAQEHDLSLGLSGSFRGNIGGFLNFRRSSFNFAPTYYQSFFSGPSELELTPVTSSPEVHAGLYSVRLRSWISSWERAELSLGASWEETPIFSNGVPLDLGESWSGDLGLTLYPTGSMQAELGIRHVSIFRSLDGSRYSSATIPRVEARYQLSRATFIRTTGEYSSQERGDVLDPATGQPVYSCATGSCTIRAGSDNHDFRIQGLVGYEPSPGTVLFLGYTREFKDTSAFRFQDVRSQADGLFVKLSYLFSL